MPLITFMSLVTMASHGVSNHSITYKPPKTRGFGLVAPRQSGDRYVARLLRLVIVIVVGKESQG